MDRQLEAAGWAVQSMDGLNLAAAQGVAVREFVLKPPHGSADYLLFVDRQAVGSLAVTAGLPAEKHRPHVAKHTTGALLARQNVSAFLIKQALGHRSISSSQVYCTVSDRDASTAARSAFMAAF